VAVARSIISWQRVMARPEYHMGPALCLEPLPTAAWRPINARLVS